MMTSASKRRERERTGEERDARGSAEGAMMGVTVEEGGRYGPKVEEITLDP